MRKEILSHEKLLALRHFHRRENRLPSAREFLRLCGFSSPRSATLFYRAAEKAGYVKKSGRHYQAATLLTGLPYFESIRAGFPSPVEDETCDILTLDEYLISNREASFLIKVTGDSMNGAGIMPGDIVIVERGAKPRSGEIIVARIGDEWTLKYYVQRGARVVLRAANAKYPDIAPREDLFIGGVVRGSFRRYGR